MLTFVLMTVVLSHWVACIWGMVALFEVQNTALICRHCEDTWTPPWY